MNRWFGLLAVAGGMAVGCGSSSENAGGGGAGGNLGAPGCTQAPDCGACQGCYSKCVCATATETACLSACGLTGSGGSQGVGGGGTGAGGGGGMAGIGPGGGGGGPVELSLAGGIRITEIAVYQTVKIPIMQNGTEVPAGARNAPVVAGKPLVLRVFVTPDVGFQPRKIVARLELVSAQNPGTQEIPMYVTQPSTEAAWESAFNFDVPGQFVTPDLMYALSLLEGQPGPSGPGDVGGARFPVANGAPLAPEDARGTFKVVIVPVISNGITPDVSPQRIQQYHDRLYSMYPAPDVEINVRQAVPGPVVSGNGGGWAQLLDFVGNVRAQDNVPRNVYYHGVVTPAASFGQYCSYGCVAGLGSVPSPGWVEGRVSSGLGFFPSGGGGDSPETMAHEVGHALGREHAPCGTPDADFAYPYPGGGIGVWGYDPLKNQLKSPGSHKDIMGYCDPTWISDYTYRGMFQRISFVNGGGFVEPSTDPDHPAGRYRVVIVDYDGTLRWGRTVYVSAPMGELEEVVTYDEAGNAVGSVKGFFHPFTDLPGGFLYVYEGSLSRAAGVHSLAPVDLGAVGALPL